MGDGAPCAVERALPLDGPRVPELDVTGVLRCHRQLLAIRAEGGGCHPAEPCQHGHRFGNRTRPDSHRTVGRAGGERVAVGPERECPDGTIVADQLAHHGECVRIPEANVAVYGAAGDLAAIRTEGDGTDEPGMAAQPAERRPTGNVPDGHIVYTGGRNQTAIVRTEIQRSRLWTYPLGDVDVRNATAVRSVVHDQVESTSVISCQDRESRAVGTKSE